PRAVDDGARALAEAVADLVPREPRGGGGLPRLVGGQAEEVVGLHPAVREDGLAERRSLAAGAGVAKLASQLGELRGGEKIPFEREAAERDVVGRGFAAVAFHQLPDAPDVVLTGLFAHPGGRSSRVPPPVNRRGSAPL